MDKRLYVENTSVVNFKSTQGKHFYKESEEVLDSICYQGDQISSRDRCSKARAIHYAGNKEISFLSNEQTV